MRQSPNRRGQSHEILQIRTYCNSDRIAVGIAAFIAMLSGMVMIILLSILHIGRIVLEYVFAFSPSPEDAISKLVNAGSFFRSFVLFACGSIAGVVVVKLLESEKMDDFFREHEKHG